MVLSHTCKIKPKQTDIMKKTICIILLIASMGAYAQKNKELEKPNEFSYPVLVKLVDGKSNIFRIGLIRHNDYFNISEDFYQVSANYARFLNDNELKDKMFVYFPLSNKSGEMLIFSKENVTKLDMTYEQAMEIIIPE